MTAVWIDQNNVHLKVSGVFIFNFELIQHNIQHINQMLFLSHFADKKGIQITGVVLFRYCQFWLWM